ncbi:MAG: hypothetical protein IT436_10690 [Phycisphaerales bacterium]|nr:hypothetical protein [Phycisphaerales bacterium]
MKSSAALRMSRAVIAVGLVLGAGVAGSAEVISLSIDPDRYTSTIGTGYGGEFAATTFSRPELVIAQPPEVNIGGGVFQNFCVSNDDLIFGDSYDWVMSKTVVTEFPGHVSHPLADATAYLFTRFWDGTLDNYDYDASAGRVESAFALQLVLWRFEDALFPGDPFPPQSQAWYDEAIAAVAPGGSWYGMGTGDVWVLNLSQGGAVYQSVLVRAIPAPSGLLILVAGPLACGLRVRRTTAA